LFKIKRDQGKRKGEIEKKKKKISPPRLGRIRPNSLSLPPARRASPERPTWRTSPARLRSCHLSSPLAVSPAPPVNRARPFPLAFALSLASGPRLSALSLSPVIGYRHDHRRPLLRHIPSPLLAHQPNWHLAPAPSHPVTTVCPSHPVATTVRHHRRRGKRRRCSPPPPSHLSSPPRLPIKGTARAPVFFTPASATSLTLPRAQLSQRAALFLRSGEPSFPSLVAYSPIGLAHEFHHFTTNTVHPFPSPITPVGLAGNLTAAGARHVTADRPF
jgi:hypothetical protein